MALLHEVITLHCDGCEAITEHETFGITGRYYYCTECGDLRDLCMEEGL